MALSLLDKLPEATVPSLVLIEFAVPNFLRVDSEGNQSINMVE